jgi:glycosyltransferase involved in cell wall biosynthesis
MANVNTLKICIVLSSLSDGGTERFGATLSKILAQIGYNVHIVITHNAIEYDFEGELFNLEEEVKKSQGAISKLVALSRYFKQQNFDIIIDNRLRSQFFKELIMYRVFYQGSKIIGMVHNHKIQNYFPVNKFFSKLLYPKTTTFIGVSKKIKESVEERFGFKNVHYLYNPVNIQEIKTKAAINIKSLDYDYILYFGRFEEVAKNLTLLIKSYNLSKLRTLGIKLVLMGKGDDINYIKQLVSRYNLDDDVVFINYQPEPFPIVKQALFTVLTSNYEGFPMSIIESLASGTPVVSVDCPSGPGEVIKNNVNGLLVETNNPPALATAFNTFISDADLYKRCKENAVSSVQHLDVNVIAKAWQNLLENE